MADCIIANTPVEVSQTATTHAHMFTLWSSSRDTCLNLKDIEIYIYIWFEWSLKYKIIDLNDKRDDHIMGWCVRVSLWRRMKVDDLID